MLYFGTWFLGNKKLGLHSSGYVSEMAKWKEDIVQMPVVVNRWRLVSAEALLVEKPWVPWEAVLVYREIFARIYPFVPTTLLASLLFFRCGFRLEVVVFYKYGVKLLGREPAVLVWLSGRSVVNLCWWPVVISGRLRSPRNASFATLTSSTSLVVQGPHPHPFSLPLFPLPPWTCLT